MERVTFPAPDVLKVFAGMELCKIDIDVADHRELCVRYQRGTSVPTFVVLGDDGAELERWVGARDAESLVQTLREIRTGAPPPQIADSIDQHAALAEYYLARGQIDGFTEQLRALRDLAQGRADGELDRLAWLACTTMRDMRRWSDLETAASHYLDLVPAVHQDEARVLLGIATFELRGASTAELDRRIDALIADISTPFPGASMTDRIGQMFGREAWTDEQERAADAWVERVNSAMAGLARIGGPAVATLREALLGDNDTAAGHAATALGWMRLPETIGFLRKRLQEKRRPATRTAIVSCLAMHKDMACMGLFLDLVRSEREPTRVRAEAVDGVRNLAILTGGTEDRAVADALAAALRSSDRYLRTCVLQALCEVHAPFPLVALLDAMDDRRPMFEDCRVCDNALWCFQQQVGMNVVDAASEPAGIRCTPAVANFLEGWYSDVADRLRWDATVAHWVVEAVPRGAGRR